MGRDNKMLDYFKKLPKFKFKKIKMEDLDDIEELKEGYSSSETEKREKPKKGEHYPETHYETIKEVYLDSMKKFSDRVFILDKNDPKEEKFREYTYKEFGDDVEALGTALTKKYNVQGEKIVIIGENQYDWYVSYISVLLGAGLAVPVDKELPENEIENVVNRSKASVVIYSPHIKDRINNIMGNLPTVKYFIEMKSNSKLEGKVVGFDKVVSEGKELIKKGDDSFLKIKIDPDEFKALFFTSGTTANSKGVMVNNRQLANNVNAVSAYVKIDEEDRFFSVLPLHHTYESSIGFLIPLANGSSIAVCQGLRYISENLKETKPSVLIAVPLLIENLYKNIMKNIKKSKKEIMVSSMMQLTNVLKGVGIDVKRKVFKEIYEGVGGNLEFIVSAAAPIDKKVGKWFTDLGVIFLQGYGLTETSPISAVTPDYDTRVGSAGKTIINGKVKVDNPDENGEGELVISTGTLMMGYYEDQDATDEVIEYDEEGRRWFHSGDIGYIDKDDFIYITGRIKNVIVTQNGKNIFPEELELLLAGVEEIEECMVYGKEVEDQKELIVTCRAIPNYDRIKELYGEKTEKEIYDIIWNKIKLMNKKVTTYKAIKGLEIKDGEFIKTTTKKIKRFVEIKEGKIKEI
ncbi:MAG: AMP-binding protein [Clostridia bacterium]|nr:AMP-binding protein [Clostridia bacterium]MBR3152204.1 AMP-binding protein [Clostridia bacterium]MBR3152259.1 AMP-binding protein [Clostridia bacterium]